MPIDSPRGHSPARSQSTGIRNTPGPRNTIERATLRAIAEHGDYSTFDPQVLATLTLDPEFMHARIQRASNPFLKEALRARAHLDQLLRAHGKSGQPQSQLPAELGLAKASYATAKAALIRYKRLRRDEQLTGERVMRNVLLACRTLNAKRAAGQLATPVPRSTFEPAIEWLQRAGRFEEAVLMTEWQIAYCDQPRAADYIRIADVWMRNATPENAISLMSRIIADPVRWIDADPAATRSLCSGALARAQLQAGDARQALVSADAASAQERDRIRAVACGKLRDREGMASALKALEDDCPTPFAVELCRAQVLLDVGLWEPALDALDAYIERAAPLDAASVKAVLAFARWPSLVASPSRDAIFEHAIWSNVADSFGWPDPSDVVGRRAVRDAGVALPGLDRGPNAVLSLGASGA